MYRNNFCTIAFKRLHKLENKYSFYDVEIHRLLLELKNLNLSQKICKFCNCSISILLFSLTQKMQSCFKRSSQMSILNESFHLFLLSAINSFAHFDNTAGNIVMPNLLYTITSSYQYLNWFLKKYSCILRILRFDKILF